MEKSNDYTKIIDQINSLFPFPNNPRCELDYHNVFELTISTILSAQTTDIAVNKVTSLLFSKYPTPYELSNANISDVENIIKVIGLYHNKANNIISLANKLIHDFNGEVPNDFDSLLTLPGVGRKTANVILAEAFNIPRIAVDTHVQRVSQRLGLSENNDVLLIEKDLMKIFPQERWKEVHLSLLFFGRYLCKAKNPECERCPFTFFCKK